MSLRSRLAFLVRDLWLARVHRIWWILYDRKSLPKIHCNVMDLVRYKLAYAFDIFIHTFFLSTKNIFSNVSPTLILFVSIMSTQFTIVRETWKFSAKLSNRVRSGKRRGNVEETPCGEFWSIMLYDSTGMTLIPKNYYDKFCRRSKWNFIFELTFGWSCAVSFVRFDGYASEIVGWTQLGCDSLITIFIPEQISSVLFQLTCPLPFSSFSFTEFTETV